MAASPQGPRELRHARRPHTVEEEKARPTRLLVVAGRYQVEAAIAAPHGDATSAEETDWPQILAWYDDLVALCADPTRQNPAAVLEYAIAVGRCPRRRRRLRETTTYAKAARPTADVAERDHLVRQAARARAAGRSARS